MAAKRIRCLCGTIYDPSAQPLCPACKEPYNAAPVLPVDPDADLDLASEREEDAHRDENSQQEPDDPKWEQDEMPGRPVVPAKERIEAARDFASEPARHWRNLSSALRRKTLYASGGFALLLFLIAAFNGGEAVPKTERTAELSTPAVSTPLPTPFSTPAPVPPAGAREWIVDANSSGGARADLAGIVAKAAAGDVIVLRPGMYQGGFEVTRPVTIRGEGSGENRATLQSGDAPALNLRAPNIVLANLLLVSGDRPATTLQLSPGSSAELINCQLNGNGSSAALLNQGAALKATKCIFRAAKGTALRVETQSKARLVNCEISESQSGIFLAKGAEIEASGCSFTTLALRGAKAALAILEGRGARLDLTNAHFFINGGGINVLDGAALTMADSWIETNLVGTTDHAGLIYVGSGGTAKITGTLFEENAYGLVAGTGGLLEIERCLIDQCGHRAAADDSANLSDLPVAATGPTARVILRETAVRRSPTSAVAIIGGASLLMEDSEISGSPVTGLIVGDRSAPAAQVQIRRSFFVGNSLGLGVRAASTAKVEDTEIREGAIGVIATDNGTAVTLKNVTGTGSREQALHAYMGGVLTASGCRLQANARGALSGLPGKSAARGTLTLERCHIADSRLYALVACAQSVLTATDCTFENNAQLLQKERTAVVRGLAQSEEKTAPKNASAPEQEEPSPKTAKPRTAAPEKQVTNRNRPSNAPGRNEGTEYEKIRKAAESVRRNIRRFLD